MFILDYAFDSKIPYFNKTLNGKNYGDLIQTLCDKLLEDVITGEQMAEFQKRICWFNNFTEIIMPGLSTDLLVLPKEIKAEFKRLCEVNKEIIDNDDVIGYIEKIEKYIAEHRK